MRVDGIRWAPEGRVVLDGVSVGCVAGRITGLLGPNGSGKTSLLHVAAAIRRPDAGTVTLDGDDVLRMRPRERARRVALVEQESRTGLDLTVRDVVRLGRIPHRPRLAGWRADDGISVDRAMDLARVSHLASRSWQHLSGGERQRTHLARALAQEPDVLLLDEPTNHLDLGHQLDFLGRVRGLGLTVLTALHDLELAAAYCDDVVVLVRGRVIAAGAVSEVLTSALLKEAYAVDAETEPHPRFSRTHVRWNDVIADQLEETGT